MSLLATLITSRSFVALGSPVGEGPHFDSEGQSPLYPLFDPFQAATRVI